MHRTIEAIVHPDGRIEALEPVQSGEPRRALITILDEAPHPTPLPESDADRLDAVLRAAGLLDAADDIPTDLVMLSDAERVALAQRNAHGTPLSQIISEEREERF
ncbi:MAG: hypothetical protein HC828_08510 [Blastochloris sp.]|nr:hypothetical protein [Blastochloris sp.]